jgi:hypothetical protein
MSNNNQQQPNIQTAMTDLGNQVAKADNRMANMDAQLANLATTLNALHAFVQQQQQMMPAVPQMPAPVAQMPAPVPGLQVVQLSPAQLQQLQQAGPVGVIPTNGVAHVPTPAQPGRFVFGSHQAAVGAIGTAMAAPMVSGGVPPEVASMIAMQQARSTLSALSNAGTFVLPDAPAGFQWKWYHVLGIGLVCALVGAGGVYAYNRWFTDQTK